MLQPYAHAAGSGAPSDGIPVGSRLSKLCDACVTSVRACGASRAAFARLAAHLALRSVAAWSALRAALAALAACNRTPVPARCMAAAGLFDGAFMHAADHGDEASATAILEGYIATHAMWLKGIQA